MKITSLLTVLIFLVCSCNKQDFLDTVPSTSMVVPSSIADFQAILDNDADMNGVVKSTGQGLVPEMGEAGADNYYLTDTYFDTTLPQLFRNYYTWEKRPYAGEDITDWNRPYFCVFNSNMVLEGLAKVTPSSGETTAWNTARGSALFYRAHAFYQLAQVFAPPYNDQQADGLWGVPLRLGVDISEKISRPNLRETYQQITGDLLEARHLLPAAAEYKTRPSVRAVFGLLARVYQTMGDYGKAFTYADSCIRAGGELLDYNTLIASASYPFLNSNILNTEVIFNSHMIGQPAQIPVNPANAKVDSVLYRSYTANDLRKTVFFKGSDAAGYNFKGSYSGKAQLFAGLALDEVYLIRAECYARAGNTAASVNDLNTLLATRWKKVNGVSTYVPYTASGKEEALQLVLVERRKELCFRALRWTDLRRLNGEGDGITLRRKINGQEYRLLPGDPAYTYPIPDKVIGFNPGMPQNER